MELKQLLRSAFNKQDFIKFISERFYGFAPNLYEDEYLGKVKLDDKREIGFFVFEVKENKDIANSRVGFHKELKEYADKNLLDGAIGAFYHPLQKSWRLSFVRFSYDDNHKKQVTSQKRFTFLLGNDKTKTAHDQLKNLKYPKISELEIAFSVESVTKEFYKGLVKEYEKLLSEYLTYPSNDDNSKKEFAIRLIGRILFIKFLNKKSLVPDEIFALKDGYYHEKLEPLFFEQLNTPKSERKPEFTNDSIPFLNGGLFEPLGLDYYEYSGVSNQFINMLKINDQFFIELYEHLNQYNFTIDENSIDDSDLSIDPEMLGRIFENLLAEINPETSQNARKATGSYYTPREIVEYMVNSSLLEYLKTKTDINEEVLKNTIFKNQEPQYDYEKNDILKAISKLKILDPACGSGAFPMGLLQKIVKILNLIDEDASIWFKLQTKEFIETHKGRNIDYLRKLNIIKNTIYGIDIQPIAIEISKLRFFLSLIVDEEGEPEPLPNLEFKFVCANSLLPLYEGKTDSYKNFVKELQKLKDEYFESSGKRKKEIVEEYLAKRDGYLKNINEFAQLLGSEELTSTDIMLYNPFDPVSVAPFFDSYFMFNIKDGFDIVIGNPPYGIKLSSEHKTVFKNLYSNVHMRTPESFNYFISISFKLLSKHGYLSFIVPNNLLFQNEFEKTRKYLLDKKLDNIVNLGDSVFENASVPTCIFGAINVATQDDYSFKYLDLRDKMGMSELLSSKFLVQTKNNSLKVPSFVFGVDTKTIEIIEKVEEQSYLIDDIALEVASGISTGGDKIFRVDEDTINKNNLENDILHNVLVGREINRYEINATNHKLIYTARDTKIDEFPHVKAYLTPFKAKLETRSEAKQGILPWYAMNRQRYLELFTEPKILLRQTADSVIASFDESGFFVLDSILIFQIDKKFDISYKFALAVLNSKLTTFIYRNLTQEEGRGFAQVKPKNIRKLFIPKMTQENQKFFEVLVDCIIFLKQQEFNQNDNLKFAKDRLMVSFFERLIDCMVYELYFADELHKENKYFIEPLQKENLLDVQNMNNKLEGIRAIFEKLNDKNHIIKKNMYFIDSVEVIRIIEGKENENN